jgi:hypothetical protein
MKLGVLEGKSEVVSHIVELVARMPANALIIIYTSRRTIALDEGHTVGSPVFDSPPGCGALKEKFWSSHG